jgi:hypothetical protein
MDRFYGIVEVKGGTIIARSTKHGTAAEAHERAAKLLEHSDGPFIIMEAVGIATRELSTKIEALQ